MNIATLGVAIDPTPAQTGAAAVNRALQSVQQQAGKTTAAATAASRSTGQAATQSGNAQANAHQGMLSRMAQSIRGFFGQTNAAAARTNGLFAGMVGQVVNFLQNILSMVPGATGLFFGLSQAVGTSASSMAGMAGASGSALAVLGPMVGVVLALLAAFVALGAAAAVTWKAIGAAAEMEQLEVQYTVLIGSVEKANAVLKELVAFADKTPFDTKGVMAFGQQMINAGVSTKDLVREMTTLGDASLGNFQKMTTAVSVYTQTMSLGKLETEDLKRAQEQGIPILEGLEKAMKKNSTEIRQMITDGKVGFKDLQAGFAALAGEGGRLAGMMDFMSQTWDGKISTIQSRIDTLFTTLGRPIIDALKPALDEIDATLQGMIPVAERLGRIFAGMIVSQDWDGMWRIVGLSFEIAMKAAATRAYEAIKGMFVSLFDKISNIAKDAMNSAQSGVSSPTGAAYFGMGGTLNPATTNYNAALQADVGKPGIGYSEPIGPGLNDASEQLALLVNQFEQIGLDNQGKGFDWSGLKEPVRDDKSGGGGGSAGGVKGRQRGGSSNVPEEFRGDAYIMREFAKQMQQMNQLQSSGRMSAAEFGHRSEKLKDSTTTQLGDPEKYAAALGEWRTFQEEKRRIAEDTDKRIETGQAGMFESFSHGVNKAADQWGNMTQQMDKLGTGIANSLSTNMTNAFVSMVDGSKSASEAFADMAKAILADIARMIVQLLVELAIRYAIKAASGFFNGGSVGGTNSAGEAQIASGSVPRATAYATGGPVWGGSGGIDDIPAYLTAGEYVIPKDAAEYYGTRFLDQVRDRKARRIGFAEGGAVAASQATASSASPRGGNRTSDGGINVSVSVQVSGEDGESNQEKKRKGEKLGKSLESTVRQVIISEMREGGVLARR